MATKLMQESKRFQGQQLAQLPQRPGLYAWYYKPAVITPGSLVRDLTALMATQSSVKTTVQLRYGVNLFAENPLSVAYGSEMLNADTLAASVLADSTDLFCNFFSSDIVEYFTRPIYIGIARNLFTRVYKQHYLSLSYMWEERSDVTKYLAQTASTNVDEVMRRLQLPHSFALEARVRGIAPRDLIAHVFVSDSVPSDINDFEDDIGEPEDANRRRLERILQLLAEPVCGRR